MTFREKNYKNAKINKNNHIPKPSNNSRKLAANGGIYRLWDN